MAASETLDAREQHAEAQPLIMRTRDGIEASAFDAETLELLDGMIEPHPTEPTRVVLTRSGRLMANDISTRLRD